MLDIALDNVSDIDERRRNFRASCRNNDQQCFVTVDVDLLSLPFCPPPVARSLGSLKLQQESKYLAFNLITVLLM